MKLGSHVSPWRHVTQDTKTRKRTEDAARDRAKHGDSCSAKRVDDGPTRSTSFSMTAEPPALPCRDTVLVDNGVEGPTPCLSPVEMRTLPIAAGGLLPAGTASTATRTIFHLPPLWFYPTKEMNSRTMASIQYATYSSFWKRKTLETKTRQTLVFDPGGSTGRLRACPFLGVRHALCGDVFVWTLRWYPRLERFW